MVSSILGRALTNAAQSLYDDYVKANASFRSGAGLKAKLIRTMHGHGCPWCRKLAGTYDYDDAPADIYRRHDNCSCTVIYECGKEKQDVWTKQKGDTAEERSQKWEKRKVEIADKETEKKIAREYRDKSVNKIMDYTGMSPKEASIYYNKNKALIVKYGPEIALQQDGYINNGDIVKKIAVNRKTIGLQQKRQSGAISGALNDSNDPDHLKRSKHADLYYEELRDSNHESLISKVEENTGIDRKICKNAITHLLFEKHDLAGGYKYFDSDYTMSESLQRIMTNDKIKLADRVMIMHEDLESTYMKTGMKYEDAHALANEKYNYWQTILDDLNKK